MTSLTYQRYINPEGKLLGHLDRLAVLCSEDIIAPPINVEIDLSNRCSLGCEWCHFAHTHTKGPLANHREVQVGDLMDPSLAISACDQLSAIGVRSITWTGGGEPTLHPDWEVILEHAHEACSLDQGMYTNGCHIEKQQAVLLATTCQWVYVSLDAVDAEIYLKEKQVDRFAEACNGIRELGRAGATVGVGFLLHEQNWKRAEDMVHLASSLGASYCQFRPAVRFNTENPGIPTGHRGFSRGRIDRDFRWPVFPVELDTARFREYGYWNGHGYKECWWSGLQTVITPDGRVWTCCNKRGEEGHALGDLSTESFADIWQRRKIAQVDDRCRVMCRGHVANKAMHEMFQSRPHRNFV